MRRIGLLFSALLAPALAALPACQGGAGGAAPGPKAPAARAGVTLDPREVRLTEVRQITHGGENAEAYWSPDGKQLILQSTRPGVACDQIFRIDLAAPETQTMVSTGKGRTTCSYFFPGARDILYSSTHETDAACPATPDRSRGYVWPLYASYDIYRAKADGSRLEPLTRQPGYDAEATVCDKDGSIIFTSTRDGDIELYRMDADGKNVKRLTETPGYDGGAFFSPDCKKIVWRASRPKPGPELEDFRKLLAEGLVRPSKLELYVANADGTEAKQITYLDAASFAPSWFPSGDRIIFSSNHGDPRGREFDIFAVNVDGTGLERVTYSPGFDGFPMFSPDGTQLVFASNRDGTQQGETNVFVARWNAAATPAPAPPSAADRYRAYVAWLADDARAGRGLATAGLDASATWLEERFRALGLEPAGEAHGFRHKLEAPVGLRTSTATLESGGARHEVRPAMFSASTGDKPVSGPVVYVGYGITSTELQHDDYRGLDVKGKIVLVRRFAPKGGRFEGDMERRVTDLRWKAWNAREHGATAVIIADLEDGEAEREAPSGAIELSGDAGIPVVFAPREIAKPLVSGKERVILSTALELERRPTWNLVGKIRGRGQKGAVLIGAHYDHLGMGGSSSLAPGVSAPHNGADDNASGVAALLEAARILEARKGELPGDVYFVAFTAEELGVLGSTAFTRTPPAGIDPKALSAMINMDMVGRLRENKLQVLGGETASEWPELVAAACAKARIQCAVADGGYGPSDQTPFYAAGVPVLHLFTGAHRDYHRPTDDVGEINAAGGAQVAQVAAELAVEALARPEKLTFKSAPAPVSGGDRRSSGASLGTVPDYVGPPDHQPGVLLAGVRAGGPAEAAGLRRGDIVKRIDGKEVRNVEDLMYVLSAAKPGVKGKVSIVRDGQPLDVEVTFGAPMRR